MIQVVGDSAAAADLASISPLFTGSVTQFITCSTHRTKVIQLVMTEILVRDAYQCC